MCMSAVGAVLQRVRESNGAPVHQSDVEQRTTAASVDSMLFDGALRPLDCDTASRSDQAEFVRIDGKVRLVSCVVISSDTSVDSR